MSSSSSTTKTLAVVIPTFRSRPGGHELDGKSELAQQSVAIEVRARSGNQPIGELIEAHAGPARDPPRGRQSKDLRLRVAQGAVVGALAAPAHRHARVIRMQRIDLHRKI